MAERRRQKVYDWEGCWYHWNINGFDTVHKARAWVKWALEQYGVPAIPRVLARPKSKTSFFRPIDWSIHFRDGHLNLASALHEAAHAIHFWYYGDTGVDDHDEKWLGIYVWLMCNTPIQPCSAVKASLAAAGLTYSHMMTPAVLARKESAVELRE